MRRIKTSTGVTVLLDGDLLAIMDVLYREVTARHELERSFDDMNNEISNLIDQMTAPELRKYLQEALFVSTITYENQLAAAYIKRVGGQPLKGTSVARCARSGPDVETQCSPGGFDAYRSPLRDRAQLSSDIVGSMSTSPPTYTVGWLALRLAEA